jgi:hypothetical protein
MIGPSARVHAGAPPAGRGNRGSVRLLKAEREPRGVNALGSAAGRADKRAWAETARPGRACPGSSRGFCRWRSAVLLLRPIIGTYAAGNIRVVMAIRFHALITVIAQTS